MKILAKVSINSHNTFALPISTSTDDQGIALPRKLDNPVVGMNHNGPYTSVGGGRDHALEDYQIQLMLLEQQNKKRSFMARKSIEDQDTALRTITSLPDQLTIAHTSVKELLENLPAYCQNIEDFKCSIPSSLETLQGYEEQLRNKEAEIKALENRYTELIQMTPDAQQRELWRVRDKALRTMQQDCKETRLKRDNKLRTVEERNGRIEGMAVAIRRSVELVPELIEDLIKLEPKLCDVRMANPSDGIQTTGENYEGV